jgi:hypothetical protein
MVESACTSCLPGDHCGPLHFLVFDFRPRIAIARAEGCGEDTTVGDPPVLHRRLKARETVRCRGAVGLLAIRLAQIARPGG